MAAEDELLAQFQQLGFSEQDIREALIIFEDCPDRAEQAGSWLMENHEPNRDLAIQQPPVPEEPALAVLLAPEPPPASPQVVMGVPMAAAPSPAAANQVEAAQPEVQPPPAPPHSHQSELYGQHKHLVDKFIGTVTDTSLDGEQKMSRLREQQLQAESVGLLGLVNQLCYWHEQEGRSPLAYATALNMTSTVRALIDLKADVNAEVCPRRQLPASCRTPLATLVCADR